MLPPSATPISPFSNLVSFLGGRAHSYTICTNQSDLCKSSCKISCHVWNLHSHSNARRSCDARACWRACTNPNCAITCGFATNTMEALRSVNCTYRTQEVEEWQRQRRLLLVPEQFKPVNPNSKSNQNNWQEQQNNQSDPIRSHDCSGRMAMSPPPPPPPQPAFENREKNT